jgi:hypothetical protein
MPYLNDPLLKTLSPQLVTGFELAAREEEWSFQRAFYHLGQVAVLCGAILRKEVPVTSLDVTDRISCHVWFMVSDTNLIQYSYGSARLKFLIFNHRGGVSDEQLHLLRLIAKDHQL